MLICSDLLYSDSDLWAIGGTVDDNHVRKMQLAIAVLLEEPDDLNNALETELRLLRDKLHVLELQS